MAATEHAVKEMNVEYSQYVEALENIYSTLLSSSDRSKCSILELGRRWSWSVGCFWEGDLGICNTLFCMLYFSQYVQQDEYIQSVLYGALQSLAAKSNNVKISPIRTVLVWCFFLRKRKLNQQNANNNWVQLVIRGN